jgi:hypothetical protein
MRKSCLICFFVVGAIAPWLTTCGKTDLYLQAPGEDDGGADTDTDSGTGQWVDPTADCPCPFDRVYDVFGTSSSDVYLLGGEDRVLHFNGQAWSLVELPGATKVYKGWIAPTGELFVVDVIGDTPVWWTSAILSRTGASWSAPWTQDVFEHAKIRTLWGLSGDQVYALGMAWVEDQPDESGWLLGFDGEQWDELLVSDYGEPMGIWGTSPENLWAVGPFGYKHYDGEAWTDDPDDPDTGTGCKKIWGSGPDDVYITRGYLTDVQPYCFHYDGSAWELVTVPLHFKPHVVWGTGADDLFMAGRNIDFAPPGSCPAAHWDGQSFTETPCEIPADAENFAFIELWGSSNEDVYGIVRWGEWFGLKGGGYDVLHFNGIEWRTLCEGIYLPEWEDEYWS